MKSFCWCDRIDGRDVKVDIPLTPATESLSTRTEPVDIGKPLHSTASSKPLSLAQHCDSVGVGVSRHSRQSYASVVSTRQENTVSDVELPCPGQSVQWVLSVLVFSWNDLFLLQWWAICQRRKQFDVKFDSIWFDLIQYSQSAQIIVN